MKLANGIPTTPWQSYASYYQGGTTLLWLRDVVIPIAATIILEFIVYYLIIKKNPKRLFTTALIINLLSWPLAFYLYGRFYPTSWWGMEAIVAVVEIPFVMILARPGWKKATLASVLGNAASALFVYFSPRFF